MTVTTEDTYAAYVACRKGKRTAVSCIEFETDLVANLARLTRQINDCTWHPQSHMCFVVLNPKPREIWASPFADRVVHHVAYRALRHRFEPHWIASTFACIPGRGTGAACQWAQDAARDVGVVAGALDQGTRPTRSPLFAPKSYVPSCYLISSWLL